MNKTLQDLYEQLRGTSSDELLTALVDLRRLLPTLDTSQLEEAASAVATLLYIDTTDHPELSVIVEQAEKLIAAMGPELTGHLIGEMRGADTSAMLRLSQVLAHHGAAVIDPILESCSRDSEPHLLVGAIYALSKIRAPEILRALPLFLEHCGSDSGDVRDGAVRALGKLVQHQDADLFGSDEREQIHRALIQATHDTIPAVRAKAVRGLGKMAAAGLLSGEARTTTRARLEQIVGRHDRYEWDTAFVVRREGEEALEKMEA